MSTSLKRRKFLVLAGLGSSSLFLPACSIGINKHSKTPLLNTNEIIDSITDLRSLSNRDLRLVKVLGYYGQGSLGGGTFFWDNKCTQDDDSGFIIRPEFISASAPGRWIRTGSYDYLTPDFFGAKRDGTSDDSHAVRQMLLFAIANKGSSNIFFPAGVYSLPNWEMVSSDVELHITGAGAKLLGNGESFIEQCANLYCSDIYFSGFKSIFQIRHLSQFLDFYTLERIQVKNSENLLFWEEGNPGTGAKKIVVRDCVGEKLTNRFIFAQPAKFNSFTIENCNIKNVNNHGFLIGNNNRDFFPTRKNIYITNNVIDGIISTGNGIYSSEKLLVEITDEDPFTSGGNETQAILLYGLRAFISGNLVRDIGRSSSGDSEGIYTKCLFATVTNNTLINAGGSPDGFLAIKDYRAEPTEIKEKLQKYNILIDGNIFHSTKETDSRAISCQRSNVHLLNNKFTGTFSSSSYVIRMYGLLQKIKITNNEFLLEDFSDGRKIIGCIRITNSVKDIIFSNNYLENWGQSGINFGGDTAEWITVTHNQFKECGARETQSRAFDIVNKELIKGLMIQGNIIQRMRRGILLSLKKGGIGDKVLIKDNVFDHITEKNRQLPDITGFTNSSIKDNIIDS